ncbi:MAG: type II toxin-antitoxin system HicA family toxin [Dehalococcoidia bacterium]|nr:type II toxin-antitoxin system HicA family toxin [Dehalococcoidia bacterium]
MVRALERAGFVAGRPTGSHVILTRAGLKRPVVVPMHRRELPRGAVKDIIRQAGRSIDEFVEQL